MFLRHCRVAFGIIINPTMMKTIALILAFAFSFSLASEEEVERNFCRLHLDKYDRLAMLSRNFIVGDHTRWPNATVPYVLSEHFTEKDVANIEKGLAMIMESTCIKFVKYTNEKNHLKFITGRRGCYANLGFNKWRSWTMVHLQNDSWCTKVGPVHHETLHALGFNHEHNRPDRNEYLKVQFQNVRTSHANWYRNAGVNEEPPPPRCNSKMTPEEMSKCAVSKAETFGIPYDYGSVMHYYVGKVNNSRSIMYPIKKVPWWITIGHNREASHYDYLKINKAYPCDKKITSRAPTTTKKPCRDHYSNCINFISSCKSWGVITKGCRKTCGTCD